MRSILSRSVRSSADAELTFVTEAVSQSADWSFTLPEHVLIVHRAGALRSLETEFENGLAAHTLPSVGDVWAAPGGEKYSAVAREGQVSYCEIRIERRKFARREMAPRIAYRDGFLHALIERAASLTARDDDVSNLLFASIVETARLHIGAVYFGDANREHLRFTDGEAQTLRGLIERNIEGRHTAASLADAVGLGEGDFLSAFGATFGVSPHQFLIERRIERARRLLRETRLSLTEIAMRTGFATPSHFSTTFRARTGVSPRDYRRLGG